MADANARLTRLLADLERRVTSMERGSQLSRSSLNINGQDVSVADAVRASISADEKAAQAISDASSALAKADGVVHTYFTNDGTPPGDADVNVGDFWYRRDTGFSSQWDGTAWQPTTSKAVSDALAAASRAESAVDGKISTFYSTTQPANPGVGDIWYKPPANEPRRWNGTSWDLIRDGKIQDALDAAATADSKATTALNSANGRTKVVYSTHGPDVNGVNEGDTWFRIDGTGVVTGQWGWQSGAWVSVVPQSATIASLDAGRITTGTLAAGVSITAGTPGSTRVELGSFGLRAYNGGAQYLSAGSDGFSFQGNIISNLFRTSNAVNGGTSYVLVGDSGDSDSVDGVRFVRPGNSQVTLKNTSDSGGGTLDISFRSGSNVNQGGFSLRNGALASTSSFLTISAAGGGSSISLGSNLSLYGGNSPAYFTASQYSFGTNNGTFYVYPTDGNGNLSFGQQQGGAAVKVLSGYGLGVQIRTAYDSSYGDMKVNTMTYNSLVNNSNPRLKTDITRLNMDWTAMLRTVEPYVWTWNVETAEVSGAQIGMLTTEVPDIATPPGITPDDEEGGADAAGYDFGVMLTIAVQAIRELDRRTTALEAPA